MSDTLRARIAELEDALEMATDAANQMQLDLRHVEKDLEIALAAQRRWEEIARDALARAERAEADLYDATYPGGM